MRLQSKVLLLIIPAIVLPLLVIGWFAYTKLTQTHNEEIFRQVDTAFDQIALHLNTHIEKTKANAVLLANSNLVHNYLLRKDKANRYELIQPALLKLFISYQKAYPEYSEIRLLLPDGHEDVRLTRGDIPNVSEEEGNFSHFQRMVATSPAVYTRFFYHPDNHTFSLLVAKSVAFRDPPAGDAVTARPSLKGYLALTSSLDFLREQIDRARIGKIGYLMTTDTKGDVIYPHDPSENRCRIEASLRARLGERIKSLEILPTRMCGVPVYLRVRPLAEGLWLWAVVPEQEIDEAGRHIGALVAGVTLATMLLAAALVFGALRSLILSPLENLRRATSDGHLAVNLSVDRKDEIGDLAKSFEEMSRSLQRSNDQIHRLAYHDSLTGLPNRLLFMEYLQKSLAYAKRSGGCLAVIFLDLDNFKHINDTLGHQTGDELLIEIAQRLRSCLRDYDYVSRSVPDTPATALARLGGDEFTVLLPYLRNPYEAIKAAQRIKNRLSQPLLLSDQEFYVNASIGITTYPADGDNASDLIKNADIAMYYSKECGKNSYHFFTDAMNANTAEWVAIDQALHKAIQGREFELYYQPIVDVRTQLIVAAEALIRWNHPNRGLLGPDYFIKVAEDCGLIAPIGEWVLNEACRQNRLWQARGLRPITVSVNVSNRQFNQPDFEGLIARALHQSGLDPRHLQIELTESSVIQAEEEILRALSTIKTLGVRIAMDDFGTGYSSLGALYRLPVDALKIDRSFVKDILTKQEDRTLVSTIIAMAKNLNLTLTAEGVEDLSQLAFLHEKGCDQIQGYLVSPPLPAAAFEKFLREPIALSA